MKYNVDEAGIWDRGYSLRAGYVSGPEKML